MVTSICGSLVTHGLLLLLSLLLLGDLVVLVRVGWEAHAGNYDDGGEHAETHDDHEVVHQLELVVLHPHLRDHVVH